MTEETCTVYGGKRGRNVGTRWKKGRNLGYGRIYETDGTYVRRNGKNNGGEKAGR
jgi:hypothetical protein